MDLTRISNVVAVDSLRTKHVVIVGLGGSMTITEGLVRCGVGKLTAIDPDRVESANVARQSHQSIGEKKVRAAGEHFRKINPEIDYYGLALRHDQVPNMQWREILSDADLIVLATDSFAAQAFGNRLALQYSVPAMWIGLYPGAPAGEIVWWTPQHKDCFRCLLERRYLRQAESASDPVSDGALLQDLQIVDGIAGHLALGLLTRGSSNYFGGLIGWLGERQFLQIKLRHDWLLDGIDPVGKALGVSQENDSYFCWNSAVKVNGMRLAPCPDCVELLGRTFDQNEFVAVEIPESDSESSDETATGRIQL